MCDREADNLKEGDSCLSDDEFDEYWSPTANWRRNEIPGWPEDAPAPAPGADDAPGPDSGADSAPGPDSSLGQDDIEPDVGEDDAPGPDVGADEY